jgi:Ca2+-transporting ATPase
MPQHSLNPSFDDLAKLLKTDLSRGLSQEEASQRIERLGLNSLERVKPESIWSILLRQVNSLIVWILAAAAVVSFLMGDSVEGFAVIAVIVINTATGFILEYTARQSMEALRKMDTNPARVLRDGTVFEISSEEVTEGDILIVEAGDLIAADATLFEVNQLEIDESPLTGESIAVSKNTEPTPTDASLGDQINRLFKGTAVTNGNGKAIITGIGQATELGKIATLVKEAKRSSTPLEAKLDALAKVLIWITLALAVLFLVTGLLRGEATKQLIETAVALAIAAIPEGMSVVATIALAYGMLRLAERKVIIKRLSAVETLGGTNIIFTDKTGTLTQNKIEVHALHLTEGDLKIRLHGDSQKQTLEILEGEPELTSDSSFSLLARTGALANNAQITGEKEIGDPVEIALLNFAKGSGINPEVLREEYPRVAEVAFSSDTRIMATLHQLGGRFVIAVKGATEEILKLCSWSHAEESEAQFAISENMAKEGLRTLAFAYRELDSDPGKNFLANQKLHYAGLIGFLDPPRKEVTPALEACKRAGIKVIMVTGDHPSTSLNIARQVHLIEEDEELVLTGKDLQFDNPSEDLRKRIMDSQVFARVNPTQKLRMIEFYQHQGNIVGMTGDGVNDAPALKKSDIGIAMGLRGTAVAAEAADMVLKDDSFTSIAHAIEQGRVIFENIRKFIVFLLSCNMSEIFVVTFAALLNVGTPLLPLQILFINIITDVFPALALGMGKENGELMNQPPRDPQKPLLLLADWKKIVYYSLVMTACVLGTYWYGIKHLGMTPAEGSTLTFYALSLTQILHVFNLYSGGGHFFNNEVTRNKYIWYALGVCTLILLGTYQIPILNKILAIEPIGLKSLDLILFAGFAPLFFNQLLRRIIASKNSKG